MVASRDAEGGQKVVGDAPEEGWAGERGVESEVETQERNQDDEGGVEPINLFVPIANGHILILDVCCFLGGRGRGRC